MVRTAEDQDLGAERAESADTDRSSGGRQEEAPGREAVGPAADCHMLRPPARPPQSQGFPKPAKRPHRGSMDQSRRAARILVRRGMACKKSVSRGAHGEKA